MKEGRLIVERRDASDIGMRDLYVIVDELPEETLLYGGSLELPLPPGEHRVKVTNRLFSKVETFMLGEGQTVRFSGANVGASSLLAPLMIITGTGAYKVALKRM
ncbi:hypothetical protein BH11ARM2_BH11ARM2_29540 [soil metagenome]